MMTWVVVRASGEGSWLWTGAGLLASLVWYSGVGAVLVSPRSRVSWSVITLALLLACIVIVLEPAPFRGGVAACAGSGVFALTLAGAFLLFRWWFGIASQSTPWSVLTVVLCGLTCLIEGAGAIVSGEALKSLADPQAWQRELARARTGPTRGDLRLAADNSASTPRIGLLAEDVRLSRWSECLEELMRDNSLQRSAREMADEDLVALVMDSVCRRDEKFRIADLNAYFFRSLGNAARKRQNISANTCELTEQLACPDVREGLVSDYEVRLQKELICRLPPEEQLLLTLHFVKGRTWSEVGARLNPPASEAAVKKRFERIRRSLREEWEALCN